MANSVRIFVVDNYDSFTWNLIHLIEQLGLPYVCRRNDKFEISEVEGYSHILISPGPGLPQDAGKTMDIIHNFKSTHSILGVCLGMQALLRDSGAQMTNLETVQHGAQEHLSLMGNSRLFKGISEPIRVGRYHSWGFLPENCPKNFQVTSTSKDGFVMSVEHSSLPLFGVQFHPESIMTDHGLEIVRNWVFVLCNKL